MFPHTITIYRHSIVNGSDVITRQVVNGVYWYGAKGSAANGKGETEDDGATIITSPDTAREYGTGWTVQPKDRVIKGVGATVTSLKDIPRGITVLHVDENVCGSKVDNITITGR